jgi:hypothetical protein
MIVWAALGTLPGLVLVALSGPVEPDLDLLLGVGGVLLMVIGALVGGLAGREEDPKLRRRVAGGAALGAAVGAAGIVLPFPPILGAVLVFAGAFVGAGLARRSAGSPAAEGR